MYLFVGIAIITFFLTYIQNIIRFLSIGSRFLNYENDPKTLEEIESAKMELKDLEQSDIGDYAKMVRRMRAESKINELRKALRTNEDLTRLKSFSVDLFCANIIKGLFLLTLFIISFKYRYTPVAVFDDRFNFAPFSGIITFPTGVNNGISVPFWVLSCNLTFRWLASVIKTK